MRLKCFHVLLMMMLLCVTGSLSYSADLKNDESDEAVRSYQSQLLIAIRPAGTVRLTDPLGRRVYHKKGKKDILEIPRANYYEERPDEDEPYMGAIDIENPIGGHYILEILKIPDKDYILQVSTFTASTDKDDAVLFNEVPIKKGQTHVYDICYDQQQTKIRLVRRKIHSS